MYRPIITKKEVTSMKKNTKFVALILTMSLFALIFLMGAKEVVHMDYIIQENYSYSDLSLWYQEDNEYGFAYDSVWLDDYIIGKYPELEEKRQELHEIISKYSYESTGEITLYDKKSPTDLAQGEKYITMVLTHTSGDVKTLCIYEDGFVRAGKNTPNHYVYFMPNAKDLIEEIATFLSENPELVLENFTE